jgi:hypothetical protein
MGIGAGGGPSTAAMNGVERGDGAMNEGEMERWPCMAVMCDFIVRIFWLKRKCGCVLVLRDDQNPGAGPD